MSLARIVKEYQCAAYPTETADEDEFNNALELSEEGIDELYETYLAQDGVNRLGEQVDVLSHAVNSLLLRVHELERNRG